MISTTLLLKLVDRLAAQYAALDAVVTTLSPVASQAKATLTPASGANNVLVWTAATAGSDGNNITIQYRDPAANSQPLTFTVTGTAVVVNLATGGGGAITSTAVQILAAAQASVPVAALVAVAHGPGSDGSGVVTAIAATPLTGGLHGLLEPLVLGAGDAILANSLATVADRLDQNVTTDLLVQKLTYWTAFVGAIRSYFSAASQAGLIDGFLTTNGLRVHQFFDQLHFLAAASHLSGPNVFAAASQALFTATGTDGPAATLTLRPTGAKAQATLTPTSGTNNGVVWTAATAGISGNATSIEYRLPGAISRPLYIEVEGHKVVAWIATDGAGAAASTASQVTAAVAAHGVAASLLTGANVAGSTGAGLVTALAATYLTNTLTGVTYTATFSGAGGNAITVAYVVAGTGTALSVAVTGTAITVNVATDGSGNPISTAAQVIAAVNASGAASALVTATPSGTTTGVVSAVAATPLRGGVLAGATTPTPLGTGSGPAGAANYAAQQVRATITPAARQASLSLLPANGKAYLDVALAGANTGVRYTAVAAGSAANAITVGYVFTQVPSTALAVVVVGNAITVTLGTDAASAASSTASNIVSAINGSGAAAALVTASLAPGSSGAGIIGAVVPATNLSNAPLRILYTAAATGTGGNATTVAYVVAGTSTPLSVGVAGSAITVNLATDGSGVPTSTVAQVLAALAASGPATALATAAAGDATKTTGVLAATGATNLAGGSGPNLAANATLRLTLLRSDLATVTRDLAFVVGATPGTVVAAGAVAASLTTGGTGMNNALVYTAATAATAGTAGNAITAAHTVPSLAGSPLSVAVVGSAITVNHATDTQGLAASTADEVAAAIAGSGPASALVTATVSGDGFGLVAAQAATALAGGSNSERFYGVTAAQFLVGGGVGDSYTVTSIVERAVHL